MWPLGLKTLKKVSPKTNILRNDKYNKRYFIKFVYRSIALDRRLLTVYFLANHLCNCQSFLIHPFKSMCMRHEKEFCFEKWIYQRTRTTFLTVKNLPSYNTSFLLVCVSYLTSHSSLLQIGLYLFSKGFYNLRIKRLQKTSLAGQVLRYTFRAMKI
jgi:hypothetical protein